VRLYKGCLNEEIGDSGLRTEYARLYKGYLAMRPTRTSWRER